MGGGGGASGIGALLDDIYMCVGVGVGLAGVVHAQIDYGVNDGTVFVI